MDPLRAVAWSNPPILAGLVREVYPAFEARKFVPFVHKVMSIGEATEVHAILGRGENRGKVVLSL